MRTIETIWALIERNPDRTIYIVLTVASFIARFAAPGSRWGAAVTSMAGDLVKLLCLLLNKTMPGGFSPAPAAIPATTDAVAKMPEPTPSQRPGSKPPAGPRITGLTLSMLAVGSMLIGGCAWFTPAKQAETEEDGVGLAICVADGYLAGLTPAAIAKNCGDAALDDVLRLIAVNEKVTAHAHAGASPSGSISACPIPSSKP